MNGFTELYPPILETQISLALKSSVAYAVLAVVVFAMAGCSPVAPKLSNSEPPEATSAAEPAVRSMPVVPGRPARVFIFAGFGDNCEPLAAPQIVVTEPPAKGTLTFVPGQETTIQYSAKGTCVGRKATGTGIYYTARAGQDGADRFSVSARLSNGEPASRTFEVKIAE